MVIYKKCGNVIILGDLNSRIGLRSEQIENDRLNDALHQPLDTVVEYVSDDVQSATHRCSMDTSMNSFGRKLLEYCRTTQLLILNGRHSGDKDGKFTFFSNRGMSVNDYCIVSNSMWSLINNFRVDNFNEFSDHAPLMLELQRLGEEDKRVVEKVEKQAQHIYRWKGDNSDVIRNSLLDNQNKLKEIVSNIDAESSESIILDVHEFMVILNEVTESRKSIKCSLQNKGGG